MPSSQSFPRRSYLWLRRIIAPSVRELSRTGKIFQTLWAAAQIQLAQRRYYRQAGEQAIRMVQEGQLKDIQLERILAKIQRSERLLQRQDLLLRSYQQRGDIREVLRIDRQQNRDQLEPV